VAIQDRLVRAPVSAKAQDRVGEDAARSAPLGETRVAAAEERAARAPGAEVRAFLVRGRRFGNDLFADDPCSDDPCADDAGLSSQRQSGEAGTTFLKSCMWRQVIDFNVSFNGIGSPRCIGPAPVCTRRYRERARRLCARHQRPSDIERPRNKLWPECPGRWDCFARRRPWWRER
jgi:hypothetical protein